MTTLISGTAGFIGSSLARRLLENKNIIIGVDNFVTGSRQHIEALKKDFPETFYFIEHDVTNDWQLIQDFCKKNINLNSLSTVYHLASPASPPKYLRFPIETIQANTVGLQKALFFADKFSARLIFSSTSEIYGDYTKDAVQESDLGTMNCYSARACYFESKRLGESILFSHNRLYQKAHGLVRLFNTYGPQMDLDDGRVIPSFIKAILNDQPIVVFGDGSRTRSFCYIDDCVSGLISYAETNATFPVNIGNDHEISMGELAKMILVRTHSSSTLDYQMAIPDDPIRRKPDLTLAKKILAPWTPKVSLNQGLESCLEFYRLKNKTI